jgi:SAM-dependent methyltransferase
MELLMPDGEVAHVPHSMLPFVPGPLSAAEESALRGIRGPVLDIGCGAGRHTAYLRARGLDCVGVDHSPDCIALGRSLGIDDLVLCDIAHYTPPKPLGAALIMGGSLGIGGSYGATRDLVSRVSSFMRDDATWVVSSLFDPNSPDALSSDRWEVHVDRFRFRWDDRVGPWVDFAVLSPVAAARLLEELGWVASRPISGLPLPLYYILARRVGSRSNA